MPTCDTLSMRSIRAALHMMTKAIMAVIKCPHAGYMTGL